MAFKWSRWRKCVKEGTFFICHPEVSQMVRYGREHPPVDQLIERINFDS